jgi:hypothetical protein
VLLYFFLVSWLPYNPSVLSAPPSLRGEKNMTYSPADLSAYLDEALPAETMAAIEEALRQDPKLCSELAQIIARRDSGVHSLGDIWRRHRLTCPSREQLGSFLLGILEDEESAYVKFHIDTIGCRCCQANLADLKTQHAESTGATAGLPSSAARRRKYFQSSAGHLQSARR